MSTWKFDDWAGRQYDDPAIGLVQPGETREVDSAPDSHWTLVPEGQETAGNGSFPASSGSGQAPVPDPEDSGKDEGTDDVDDSTEEKGDD